MKTVLVMIGPPGSGKGTQARNLTQVFDIPAISTGDILRAESQSDTPLGRRVRALIDAGRLVGDEIMNQIVENRLSRPDCTDGFILDGYPRTVAQAQFLDRVLPKLGLPLPKVLHFELQERVLVDRLCARRYCPVCGRIYNLVSQPPADHDFCDDDGMVLSRRTDDTEDVVLLRMRTYQRETEPVLAFYRGRELHRLDAGRGALEVFEEIERRVSFARSFVG
jgi:adenylate kinase